MSKFTGWLDRDGKLYPCDEWEHSEKAREMGYTYPQLERLGYVHVGSDGGVNSDKEPSQAQLTWLYDVLRDNDTSYSLAREIEYYLSKHCKKEEAY